MRPAWAWAKTSTDAEGNSLQCNTENGGDNQQVQPLVPADKLNMARQYLQEYKESISPFSMREQLPEKESHKLILPRSMSQQRQHITI